MVFHATERKECIVGRSAEKGRCPAFRLPLPFGQSREALRDFEERRANAYRRVETALDRGRACGNFVARACRGSVGRQGFSKTPAYFDSRRVERAEVRGNACQKVFRTREKEIAFFARHPGLLKVF